MGSGWPFPSLVDIPDPGIKLQSFTLQADSLLSEPPGKPYDKPRQCIKEQRHHFANKDPYSQSYGFSSSHVWIWNLDHKEARVLKNWCFQIVVVEKNLENLSDCKEIKPVNCKGNQPEYSLEGLVLKWSWSSSTLGHLMGRADSLKWSWCWERLKSGEGNDRM